MAGGRLAVMGAAKQLVIVAFKGIFAELRGRKDVSAPDLLAQSLSTPFEREEIIVSNAVEAVRSVEPIRHKLTVLPLGGEIRRMIKYLQQNPIPLDEGWLREPEAGLLELSLVEEKYE
ncbi:MAG: hypothetical protein U0946_01865 [Patescibacteria group bacterium]|nr:hypothetical protein [Patescibacteria group bacterium]